MFESPLERAIARGMKPGGDIVEELQKLGDYTVRSSKDGKAICRALRELPARSTDDDSSSSPLHALTGLFQDVDGRKSPAFDVLYKEGLPELIRIYNENVKHLDDKGVDDLLFVLKILAMYGSREGAATIIDAAHRPLKPDAYMWHVVLSAVGEGHPQRDYVYQALSDPLPPEFIAVALVDSANAAAREGELERHPFDSAAGWKQLQSWLEDRDPDHFSYAHSATATLPFMTNPPRDQLLALAMDHADAGVQMEAAWAAGKLGREAGLKFLARFCLDTNHSDVARQYLTELGRDDLIPAEANEPGFKAKAEFAGWLSHPSELGKPPDELEIVDHRQLAWPPERVQKPFWLIRYRLSDKTGLDDDDVDCGLVGSMTWCFFSYKMHQRPPADAYAIHCYWEMQHQKLIEEQEVTKGSEYAKMLDQWQGAALQEPKITRVATFSSQLTYPTKRVALVAAKHDGEDGWAVLDGPASAWYPKDEQPAKTFDSVVLMIHVGRQLLGFHDRPDRKKYLVAERPARSAEQIVSAYEKLLTDASEGGTKRQKELLDSFGLLSNHFDAYVDARAVAHGSRRAEELVQVYERFLSLAESVDSSIREEVYDTSGVLGDKFDEYIDALMAQDRMGEVMALVDRFAPHWQNNLGYGRLGTAAFRAGQPDAAEPYFMKLREGIQQYHRAEEMSMLAEIWHARGEAERARALLLDCLRRLVGEIEGAKFNSDRERFQRELVHHRATYLRLFPDGEADLTKAGIPE